MKKINAMAVSHILVVIPPNSILDCVLLHVIRKFSTCSQILQCLWHRSLATTDIPCYHWYSLAPVFVSLQTGWDRSRPEGTYKLPLWLRVTTHIHMPHPQTTKFPHKSSQHTASQSTKILSHVMQILNADQSAQVFLHLNYHIFNQ